MSLEYHIGVVAHVDRKADVDALVEKIGGDVYVSMDDGSMGAGVNHLNVLSTLRDRHPDDWLVVLEDDAIVPDDFREQLRMVLDCAPTKIVSLYLGTGYPQEYQRYFSEAIEANPDTCWLLHRQLRHAVAYAIHPDVSRAVVIRMAELIARRYAPDDAIAWWALNNRQTVGYTNPSLVDHRDGKTIIDYRFHLGHVQAPGRKKPRVAHNYGTRQSWSDSSVTVTNRPEQTQESR